MNWLKRKFRNWLNRDDGDGDILAISPVRSRDAIEVDGLCFNVMPAHGGTIVQIRHYDRKTDRNNHITHIITSEEDVAERIGHIVSMELLRTSL